MRAPEGDGCAERVIRTLKEQLLWVKSFATTEELRVALIASGRTLQPRIDDRRHGFRSPAAARREFYDRNDAKMVGGAFE